MLEKIMNYLSNKKNNNLISKDFSFLDFSYDNEERDLFYIDRIEAKNFFENENGIGLDNSKWEDAYDELKAMWMFWVENFSYFVDLLFTWETTNKSIIDCLNIESRIKKNNYIELTLQLRDYKTNNQIIIKRIFQNIENDTCDNNFYYYENEELITTNPDDGIVKRKFRTMKVYNRTLFLAQILYVCIDEKNKYQNELDKLEKEKKKYEIREYKKLKNGLIENYNKEYEIENHISKILYNYDKEELYETMDYINKNPRFFAKDEEIIYAEMVLTFLYNIWFTNIPQTEANKIFEIVDKDIRKYSLHRPLSSFSYFFKEGNKDDKDLPFMIFMQFFNRLLTWDRNKPINLNDLELCMKSWLQTPYNTKDFRDYIKQTLLDKNGNIKLEVLEKNF